MYTTNIKKVIIAKAHSFIFQNPKFLFSKQFLIFRNPYDPSCLSIWGGPSEPELVAGGFSKPEKGKSIDFKTATGVVLTFVVQNHLNKTALEAAMKWEQR